MPQSCEPRHDKTNKMSVRQAKTQIRLGGSESSLCAQWVAKDPSFLHADSEDSVTKWIKSCLLQCFGTFKMPILMFISILVFRPEGQIWNPVKRDTRIYVRRILNASRISKTQLNSCMKLSVKEGEI